MDDNYKKLLPILVEVEAGKTYLWCRCGKSDNPPFYSEHSCECQPIEYIAKNNESVMFCNCKASIHPPLCDGSHAKLLLKALNKSR